MSNKIKIIGPCSKWDDNLKKWVTEASINDIQSIKYVIVEAQDYANLIERAEYAEKMLALTYECKCKHKTEPCREFDTFQTECMCEFCDKDPIKCYNDGRCPYEDEE